MFLSKESLEETPKAEEDLTSGASDPTTHLQCKSLPLIQGTMKSPWYTVGKRNPSSEQVQGLACWHGKGSSLQVPTGELQSWRGTWLSLWTSSHLSSSAPLHLDLPSTVAHSELLTESCSWSAKESISGPDRHREEPVPVSPWDKYIATIYI